VFVLRAPDGRPAFESTPDVAHRIVEMYELYMEGKISIVTPQSTLTFQKQTAGLAPLRELVEAGMAGDPEFRSDLRQQSLRAISLGLAFFIVGGGLFGLYCWYAS